MKPLTVKQIHQSTNFAIITLNSGILSACSIMDNKSFNAKSMITIRKKVTNFIHSDKQS